MKYFIDFEFHEGNIPQQIKGIDIPKWLSKPLPNIQMISVGIVSEEYFVPKEQNDGKNTNGLLFESIIPKQKEYYAISKDFNLKAAWNNEWVRENVLKEIWSEFYQILKSKNNERNYTIIASEEDCKQLKKSLYYMDFTYNSMKQIINKYGKTNKQIVQEIKDFVGYKKGGWKVTSKDTLNAAIKQYNLIEIKPNYFQPTPEFYGYYSDYDWVVFCQLFGTMMELLTGFPMYCKNLKQTLDEKIEFLYDKWKPIQNTKAEYLEHIKKTTSYPKQTNEHNALSKAKWNYELYKFLNTLSCN